MLDYPKRAVPGLTLFDCSGWKQLAILNIFFSAAQCWWQKLFSLHVQHQLLCIAGALHKKHKKLFLRCFFKQRGLLHILRKFNAFYPHSLLRRLIWSVTELWSRKETSGELMESSTESLEEANSMTHWTKAKVNCKSLRASVCASCEKSIGNSLWKLFMWNL